MNLAALSTIAMTGTEIVTLHGLVDEASQPTWRKGSQGPS